MRRHQPPHAVQVLHDAGVQRFPTPFVEGFGWDESGELIFPNRPEVCIQQVFCVAQVSVSAKLSRLIHSRRRALNCRRVSRSLVRAALRHWAPVQMATSRRIGAVKTAQPTRIGIH